MKFLPGSVLITDEGRFSRTDVGTDLVIVFTEKELEKIGREIARVSSSVVLLPGQGA